MRLRNAIYTALFFLSALQLMAQTTTNTVPVVSNVAFSITGTKVTVTYNVTDAEQDSVNISMEVSDDGEATWNYNYNSPDVAKGDIGADVATGNGKTITWTYAGSQSSNFVIKIIANDLVIDGGPCADAVINYAGKTYNTVQIGTQCWLKENLDVGTMVSGTTEQTNNGTTEKHCYNNDTANCTAYGGLYQWDEAMAYSITPGAKGICPAGWHIPTYAEYQTLIASANNNSNVLKALGQGTGTNTTGFSALLAGYRNINGYFYVLASYTYYWSSTEYDVASAYHMTLNFTDSSIYWNSDFRSYGFSIRCFED
ncbi:MAG: FISUMP domain-containing protein [Ignavibacteria bacterium]